MEAGGLPGLPLGQSFWERRSQGGPDHQSADMIKSFARVPRLARSAGLSADLTWRQMMSGRSYWIAKTWFATNLLSSGGDLGSQC